jgi:DNA mismatch repair protein MutS2
MNIQFERSIARLEWNELTTHLSKQAQTEEGEQRCSSLRPDLERHEIEDRWSRVEPLAQLQNEGYRPPIGQIPPMQPVFRSASLGNIFDGIQLRTIVTLLHATRTIHNFSGDFAAKCPPLRRLRAVLCPLPKLYQTIDLAVDSEGRIKDSASKELNRIRRAKISLRKRIEERLNKIIQIDQLDGYLQDDFFTVRSERYVVPMTLDGRGRIKGSIIDTSASGHTLFIEPTEISALNNELLELDVSDKIEVLRILRAISAEIAQELDPLQTNYDELIDLDFHSALATLGSAMNAGAVKISDHPIVDLKLARHPLLALQADHEVIPNSVSIVSPQRILVISGPNAGGKTVTLKTIGLMLLMARSGMLLPCDEDSSIYLFDKIFVELGDNQSLFANLSTFSGHLTNLRPILEQADPSTLILLDELAVGTEPKSGAAIAQATVEYLVEQGATTILTTHFDSLKMLAMKSDNYRNGSMEFDRDSLGPTYKLILDVPGQSYGLELAQKIGLPKTVIERAQNLRGQEQSNVEDAVKQLQEAVRSAQQKESEFRSKTNRLEEIEFQLSDRQKHLEQARRQAALKLQNKYDIELDRIRQQSDDLRKTVNQLERQGLGRRDDIKDQIKNIATQSSDLTSRLDSEGRPPKNDDSQEIHDISELNIGERVLVLDLEQEAVIVRLIPGTSESVEISFGAIKMRVHPERLRKITGSGPANTQDQYQKSRSSHAGRKKSRPEPPNFVIQSPTNAVDLRGLDALQAVDSVLKFTDQAVLRGESAIILIHGHGTDRLKGEVRKHLSTDSPYNITFRPGKPEEGGDGVTVVFLT